MKFAVQLNGRAFPQGGKGNEVRFQLPQLWLGSSEVEHQVEALGVGIAKLSRATIERTERGKQTHCSSKQQKTNIGTKVGTKSVRRSRNPNQGPHMGGWQSQVECGSLLRS